MIVNLDKKYYTTDISDTYVVMCFFSPMGFKKPVENIRYNITRLKEAKIPYVLIELLYPDQSQQIEDSIIVKASSIIFSKENLWNIALQHIPENYTKIIFLDSDIIFNISNWFDLTSNLLNDNDIVQPFEYAYRDIASGIFGYSQIDIDTNNYKICKMPIIQAIKNNEKISLFKYEPGFSIGMTRSFFAKIGGFFEYAITGSNDVMFWLSITDFDAKPAKDLLKKIPIIEVQYEIYKNNFKKYIDYSRIDYLKNSVGLHLYHGTKDNRFYTTRNKYVPENIDFYYNKYGVMEINSVDKKDLKQYWIDRKEDD